MLFKLINWMQNAIETSRTLLTEPAKLIDHALFMNPYSQVISLLLVLIPKFTQT